MESLTNKMENEVGRIITEIDGLGGIVKAVEKGWIHNEIASAAYQYQVDIESGEMPIVGINCFKVEDEVLPIELFKVPETLLVQEEKLKRIRKDRDPVQAHKYLEAITRCCEEDRNIMEVAVDAVKAYVTEGEISKTLKAFYGVWQPPLF